MNGELVLQYPSLRTEQRGIEFTKPIRLCLLDLKKAFDRKQVNHLVNSLEHQTIDVRIIVLLKTLNTQKSTSMQNQNSLIEERPVSKGIRQSGC